MVKLMVFCTESHQKMAEKFVISRAKLAGFGFENLVIKHGKQVCKSATYGHPGFAECTFDKLDAFIDVPVGQTVLYVDADVCLFENLAEFIGGLRLDRNQIACQWDDGQLCLGVVLWRQTKTTRSWWMFLKRYCQVTNIVDQTAMHALLLHAKYTPVRFCALPFPAVGNWSHIRQTNELWYGQDFELPSEVKLWHANFCIGLQQKFKMLEKVVLQRLTATTH